MVWEEQASCATKRTPGRSEAKAPKGGILNYRGRQCGFALQCPRLAVVGVLASNEQVPESRNDYPGDGGWSARRRLSWNHNSVYPSRSDMPMWDGMHCIRVDVWSHAASMHPSIATTEQVPCVG